MSDIRERLRRAAARLVEAEGAEHKRLKNLLISSAESEGFTEIIEDQKFRFGGIPDIARALYDKHEVRWCVGDAKDAGIQRATHSLERLKFRGYIAGCRAALEEEEVDAVWFTVVTNTEEAAQEWAALLTNISGHVFNTNKVEKNTWRASSVLR